MPTVALTTAIAATGLDEDMPPLRAALAAAGVDAQVVAWDDPTVSWSRFDLVLLRSTWNYTERHRQFLDWCTMVDARSRLLNAPALVRWNTDKRYLADLAAVNVPVIDSHFLAPGDDPASLPEFDEFVIKPTVGAGSRGARRFIASERETAIGHARALLDDGHHVLAQPYLADVDQNGETALLFFDGTYSHAIRKGPLLHRGEDATRALFAAEHISARQPSEAEMKVARQALAAVPFERPLYARVDLLPSAEGPKLLELELAEPSLFFDHAPGSADRFAATLRARLEAS